MDQHLASLFLTLDELAQISDALIATESVPGSAAKLDEMLERSEILRQKLHLATKAAAGSSMPSGPDGAALVTAFRSFHERIQAGDAARERIVSLRDTVSSFGRAYALQVIANLPAIASWPSVSKLTDAFAGRPALLVAAGPSLDKNIEEIRKLKGKAVIVAVSHALSALGRAGIVPDVVIAIDPSDLSHHFAHPSLAEVGAVVLATSAHPAVFDLPAERFFTVAANPGLDTWAYDGIEEQTFVATGGTVANTAFSLLHQWGCNPILLAGLDLSFDDGKYYASASCDGEARFEVSEDGSVGRMVGTCEETDKLVASQVLPVRRVPGYFGGEVTTDFAFAKAREWFVDAAQTLKGQATLLNCTEGGAHLGDMEHVPLSEAVARYATAEFSVADVLENAVLQVDRETRRAHVLARVRAMRTSVDRCIALTGECKDLAKRVQRRPELSAKLSSAESKLSAALQGVAFLSTAVQPEIRAALARGKTDRLAGTLQMYDALAKIALDARPLLTAAERKLSAKDLTVSAA